MGDVDPGAGRAEVGTWYRYGARGIGRSDLRHGKAKESSDGRVGGIVYAESLSTFDPEGLGTCGGVLGYSALRRFIISQHWLNFPVWLVSCPFGADGI